MNNQQTIRDLTVLLNSYRATLSDTYNTIDWYRSKAADELHNRDKLLQSAIDTASEYEAAIQATQEQIEALSADLS